MLARGATVAAVLGVVIGPVALAVLGLTHPSDLTPSTAIYWRDLHLIALPIFPLLGTNLWWLLGSANDAASWLARGAAFVYIIFYSALDVLAGIGTGAVVATASGADVSAATSELFAQGNDLAGIGVLAYLLGVLLTSALLVARFGRTAAPGAALLVAGALVFLDSHIYFPEGVSAMLATAAGCGWLQWARLRSPSPVREAGPDHPTVAPAGGANGVGET